MVAEIAAELPVSWPKPDLIGTWQLFGARSAAAVA
jgi:hypothetical protein